MAFSGPSGNSDPRQPSVPLVNRYFDCNLLLPRWQSHRLSAKKLAKVLEAVYLEKSPNGLEYAVTARLRRLVHAASSLGAPIMIGDPEGTDILGVNSLRCIYERDTAPNDDVHNNILTPDRLKKVFKKRPKKFRCGDMVIWYDSYNPGFDDLLYTSGMLATYQTILQVYLEGLGMEFEVDFPTYHDAVSSTSREVTITIRTTRELTAENQQIIIDNASYWAQSSLTYEGPVGGLLHLNKNAEFEFRRSKSCFVSHCQLSYCNNILLTVL